jgi:hypothetical protein
MKMEHTECSETSAYKLQTSGNYPEESIKQSRDVLEGPRCIDVSMKGMFLDYGEGASCWEEVVEKLLGSGKAAQGMWWNVIMIWYTEHPLITGPSTTEWAASLVIVQQYCQLRHIKQPSNKSALSIFHCQNWKQWGGGLGAPALRPGRPESSAARVVVWFHTVLCYAGHICLQRREWKHKRTYLLQSACIHPTHLMLIATSNRKLVTILLLQWWYNQRNQFGR